jgi:hypothetical protein
MRSILALSLTATLSACNSPSTNMLMEIRANNRDVDERYDLEGFFERQGRDFPIFYFDRASRVAYIYGRINRNISLGSKYNIRVIESNSLPVPVFHRLNCILTSSCSTSDPRFCTRSLLTSTLSEDQENSLVRFFRNRAYPINYVQVRRGPGITELVVQYYADCDQLSEDVQGALRGLRIMSTGGG